MIAIAEQHITARLRLRVPAAGDGPALNRATSAAHAKLSVYMPWAKTPISIAESETFARESAARFRAREELNYLIFHAANPHTVIGSIGLHHLDWAVPCFEFGYWLETTHTGHGYMTEAVLHLRDYAFQQLGAERLEIRCDARNHSSAAVAQRAGFPLEARLAHKLRTNDGTLTDLLIHARLRER